MNHRNRRWAWAALTAALLGTTARADDPIVVPPPPPDVTTLPIVTIPAPVLDPLAVEIPSVAIVDPIAGPAPPMATETVVPATAQTAAPPAAPAAQMPDVVIQAPALPPPQPTGSTPGGFYVGGGPSFLKPYLSNNTAYTVTTPPVPPAPGAFPLALASVQSQPFDWNCEQAFQMWLGWTHASGWGIRADGFIFNQGSNLNSFINQVDPIAPKIVSVPPIIPFIPGAAGFGAPTAVLAGAGIGADRMLFGSDLNIRSADLELTYQLAGDGFLVRLSAGGRWTSLRQGYHAALRNFGDGITTEAQQIDFVQQFSGAGPTIGLFARHDIFDGLSAYAGIRGAILAGHLDQSAAFSQAISDPNLAAFVGSQRTQTRFDTRADHVLTVAEMELGLEYGVNVGGSRLYARAGIVGQSYGNAGNASNTLGTLSLIGGTASVGVNY